MLRPLQEPAEEGNRRLQSLKNDKILVDCG